MLRGTTHIRSNRGALQPQNGLLLNAENGETYSVQLRGSGTTFSGGFTDASTNRALSLHQPTGTPALHRHLDSL